ncbi:hypothetical protein M9H77_19701 [Catharanthus roseus]|uniref:Uncharacterized protein n=2 Tax=Catharanthus roseus TaxID=4058 RepID=A0ACC0BBC8_CATRO|nr:hypothetical protein M9H77_19694 [Catharanthus roseus]KAI5669848.1 hypothetical protein M9H77_19701 [Catharanthus roseus]
MDQVFTLHLNLLLLFSQVQLYPSPQLPLPTIYNTNHHRDSYFSLSPTLNLTSLFFTLVSAHLFYQVEDPPLPPSVYTIGPVVAFCFLPNSVLPNSVLLSSS